MQVFFNKFSSPEDIFKLFKINPKEVEFIYADYLDTQGIEDAICVFQEGHHLYLVHSSVCSCCSTYHFWSPSRIDIANNNEIKILRNASEQAYMNVLERFKNVLVFA